MTQKERIAAIEKQLRRNKGDSDIWDIDFDLPQNTWKSPRFKEDLAAMFKRNKVAASTETVEEFRFGGTPYAYVYMRVSQKKR